MMMSPIQKHRREQSQGSYTVMSRGAGATLIYLAVAGAGVSPLKRKIVQKIIDLLG